MEIYGGKMARDPFLAVFNCIKRGRRQAALNLIRSNVSGRLNAKYAQDRNRAWYVVGDIYFQLRRYSEAIAAFKKALGDWAEDADSAFAIGNCYSEEGRYRLAERYFRKASGLRPSVEVKYNLANSLFDQGKFEMAASIYRRLRTRDPELKGFISKNLELARTRARAGNGE